MRAFLKKIWIISVVVTFVCAYTFFLYQRGVASKSKYTTTRNEFTEIAVASSPSYKHVTQSLAALGRTPELSKHIIFFNLVPRTGSEILVLLLQRLQGTNNFQHVRLSGGQQAKLSRLEQEELVDEVTSIIKNKAVPLTFDRNVYFLNFTSFDKQSPTYINLVRDPVEKLISRYYYKYNPKGFDWESFIKCVEEQQEKCVFEDGAPYDLTIPYFCGQDPRCMFFNDEWALSTAKANVDRYFAVVGVLEELNTTLQVFEHRLPYFFRGTQKIYFDELFQPDQNKNKMAAAVADDVKINLKKLFVCEYDFYEWVKRRLFQQLQMFYGHGH